VSSVVVSPHLPWEVAGGLQAVEAMQKALCGEASSFVSSQHLTKVRADCPSILCILAAGSKTLRILY
jgi:hypothetical protein